ncbi:MAG: HAD family hydrolase [Bacteriovorax sp.]
MSEKDSRPIGGPVRGHIIFDHDGTLVNTNCSPFILFKGMGEFLTELKSQNYQLYIWTARPRRSTLESIKRLDIARFFTEIYCFDDGIPKPHPMGLKSLTEGIEKNKILHIGDSLTDFEGAQAFGIEVVAACWNSPDQVEKYAEYADYTALNLNECLSIIKRKFYV